jgi:hypothetical protein
MRSIENTSFIFFFISSWRWIVRCHRAKQYISSFLQGDGLLGLTVPNNVFLHVFMLMDSLVSQCQERSKWTSLGVANVLNHKVRLLGALQHFIKQQGKQSFHDTFAKRGVCVCVRVQRKVQRA